jgi:hypothetical protein
MRDTPSENLSQAPTPRKKRVGNTSMKVMGGITVISAALLALMKNSDDAATSSVADSSAASASDLPESEKPVFAAGDIAQDQLIAPNILVSSTEATEKAEPKTIQELPLGDVPLGTEIKIVDEDGTAYILAITNGGETLHINGQQFAFSAIASKKTFGGFSIPLPGEYPIVWQKVDKILKDERPFLCIQGKEKGSEDAPTNTENTQEQLAELCRGATKDGKFQFPLPDKQVKGVVVSLVGWVKKTEK